MMSHKHDIHTLYLPYVKYDIKDSPRYTSSMHRTKFGAMIRRAFTMEVRVEVVCT